MFTEEASTFSPDANGQVSSPELELSEDSTKDPKDASPGKKETSRRTSAGTGDSESSSNSPEMEESADFSKEDGDNTSDAQEPS